MAGYALVNLVCMHSSTCIWNSLRFAISFVQEWNLSKINFIFEILHLALESTLLIKGLCSEKEELSNTENNKVT